jgi:hypothetical protein
MSIDKKSAKRVIGSHNILYRRRAGNAMVFVGLFHSNTGKNVIYNFS